MSDDKGLHQKANELAEAAQQLRERLQVKANLLSKEGRDAYEAARDQLKILEDKMRHYGFEAMSVTEEARVKAKLGMMEARDRLEKLHAEAKPHLEKLKEQGASEAKDAVEKLSTFLKKFRNNIPDA